MSLKHIVIAAFIAILAAGAIAGHSTKASVKQNNSTLQSQMEQAGA